jgi:hypothetical protein
MESTTLVHSPTTAELFSQAEAETAQRKDELVLTDCDVWLEAACRHGFANKVFVHKVSRGDGSFEPISFSNTPPAFISKLYVDKEVTREKIDRFHLSLQTKDIVIKYICNVESKRRDGTIVLGHEFTSLICSIHGMQDQNKLKTLVELIIQPGNTKGICFPKLTPTVSGHPYWSKAFKTTIDSLGDLEAKREYAYSAIEHLNTQLLRAA